MDAIILRGSRVNLAVLSRLAIGDWGKAMTILDCDMVIIRMVVLDWGRAMPGLTVVDWNKVKLCSRPPPVSVTGRWIRGLTVFGDVKT